MTPNHIKVTGSKSETNRLLLLQALYPGVTISNISESDDSLAMQAALAADTEVIDIHHAGTAMRFLSAYFAQKEGRSVVLTGSQRMKERPIGVLVDALRALGADIEYAENEGYPPLKIAGKKLTGSKVTIQANVSSQYITALLLIGSALPNGLELTLNGQVTSMPYINMTMLLLAQAGIESYFIDDTITVKPLDKSEILNLNSEITVESDWSSASYFYSIVALSDAGTQVALSTYSPMSLQGDSALMDIYEHFGVSTDFAEDAIILTKNNIVLQDLNLELNDTPDIAQTIAVTCFGLGIGCHLTGLHTLKIKETDRLEALKTELEKFGAQIVVTNDSLTLEPHSGIRPNNEPSVATYNDHRMAMAFAPLALKMPFSVEDAGVVSKSFPTFWEDLQKLGFKVEGL
ncbi:MAG: 3-phosphoshikimate 1-carboxyvinyltransferase [Bacteroidota bacterium]